MTELDIGTTQVQAPKPNPLRTYIRNRIFEGRMPTLMQTIILPLVLSGCEDGSGDVLEEFIDSAGYDKTFVRQFADGDPWLRKAFTRKTPKRGIDLLHGRRIPLFVCHWYAHPVHWHGPRPDDTPGSGSCSGGVYRNIWTCGETFREAAEMASKRNRQAVLSTWFEAFEKKNGYPHPKSLKARKAAAASTTPSP